jgi:hypothetical protein
VGIYSPCRMVYFVFTLLHHVVLTDCHLEVQVKKHLTAEEHAMRRAEMARRRKNLSEKRNEEEKVLQFYSMRLSSL